MTGRWGRGCVTFGELWKSEQVGCGWLAGEGAGGRGWGRGRMEGMGPAGWRTKEGKGGIVVFVGGGSGEAGGELWVSLS